MIKDLFLTEHDIACANEDYFEIISTPDVRSSVLGETISL